ncbi:MAG: SGNH/GDSL hydrolase family protein [Armatimonadetes bacterium]|nr:SGNH/GDSL hydrolase family protein [Armatimonadota bacterium]
MRIEASSNLLFIGDSITDCGRARPVGEANPWNWGEIGNGYVRDVAATIGAAYPERGIRIRNVGSSGNTVRDLAARWKSDVTDLAPDWLSVMIGINDVWRQFDSPLAPERAVPLAEYSETLWSLCHRTRPKLKGLVLMTPYVIDANLHDPMRQRMDEYGAAVQEIADEFEAVFVDTQAAFDALLEHNHPASVAWDRIHPGPVGHMTIAHAFLQGIGAL